MKLEEDNEHDEEKEKEKPKEKKKREKKVYHPAPKKDRAVDDVDFKKYEEMLNKKTKRKNSKNSNIKVPVHDDKKKDEEKQKEEQEDKKEDQEQK